MQQKSMGRRGFLGQGFAVGCSLAASPLLTPVSFAATRGDNRLVVIILRGGLDGLALMRPTDPALAALRPNLAAADDTDMELSNGAMLHASCAALWPMWQAGELEFVQAVSTPYRHKRSHFDGQDLLEAGTASLGGNATRDGWLNRMLRHMPNAEMRTAYAVGADPMLLSRGEIPVESWSPDVDFVLSSQGARLMQLTMEQDPEIAQAFSQAVSMVEGSDTGGIIDSEDSNMTASLNQMMDAQMQGGGQKVSKAHVRVAAFAGEQLRGDARVACFSLGGWDTHAKQARTMQRPLRQLSDSLVTLKEKLGRDWDRTTVVAMTEFGRTVAENGTQGTDHGTGGAMILAGGTLRGKRVLGRWPGLAEVDLFERRDLMPTDDVRRYAAWAIRESFGLDRAALEGAVFPGLDLGETPRLFA